MHLLVIEDERALCETIVRSLRRLAYSVDYCYDGDKALELLGVERYDLVLLDLNLPGKDGMTVLRTLRQTDRETRVLILSARSEVEDKVEGLDAGANDYLAKPFHLAELEARIRSLTLRQFTQKDVILTCGGLTFDTRSRTATVNGQTLTLTRKETGHSGISDGASGPAGESGGADGSCLGQQRGQLQQLHPGAHFRPAQKAPRRAGLRPHPQPHRRRLSDGRR